MVSFAPQTETISVVLGYASIVMWLGAQFPQIITNFRTKSVEGLALPFLANWLFGDLTNLVGCILTHQQAFQTNLAIYFVIVDVCLVGQYIYYSPIRFRKSASKELIEPTASPVITHRRTMSREPTNLRALSVVAANVAAAAYQAVQEHEDHTSLIRQRRAASAPRVGQSPERVRPSVPKARQPSVGKDLEEEEEDAVPAMMDSFHSDDGRRERNVIWTRPGATMTQQHPSGPPVTSATLPRDFSLNRPPASTSPSTSTLPRVRSSGQSSVDNRGRALTRNLFINPNAPPLTDEERAQLEEGTEQTTFVDSPTTWKQRSKSRRNSQASRRGASIVFLGVWALFGFGHLAGRGILNTPSPSVATGKVLASPTPDPLPSNPWPSSLSHPNLYVTELVYASQNQTDPPHHPPKREPLSRSYIIGRISAWTCATLYLTSRLPQIWKIFTRKSVEGLSMTLFVSAFLANVLYVSSLLTNPTLNASPAVRNAYIQNTIPYIIGSGGTLLFDITIVSQSFLYRGRRPRSASTYSRRRSILRTASGTSGLGLEEEEALLASAPTANEEGAQTSPTRKLYGSTISGVTSGV